MAEFMHETIVFCSACTYLAMSSSVRLSSVCLSVCLSGVCIVRASYSVRGVKHKRGGRI